MDAATGNLILQVSDMFEQVVRETAGVLSRRGRLQGVGTGRESEGP